MLDNSNPWFCGCTGKVGSWTVGKGTIAGNSGVVVKEGWVTVICVPLTIGWGWGNGREVDGAVVGVTEVAEVTGVGTVGWVAVVGAEVNPLAVFPHG